MERAVIVEYTEALGAQGAGQLTRTGKRREAFLEEVLPELNPKESL